MASLGSYLFPSRFSFSVPEMFSFSLDPEIVSFFWTNNPAHSTNDADLALRNRIVRPSQLFQIFLPSENAREEITFLSTVKCTVITTGILVVVGVSSLYTFKFLQWFRQSLEDSSLLQNVKSLISNLHKPFLVYWRKPIASDLTPTGNNNGVDTLEVERQLCKRPSDLQIIGSPRVGKLLRTSRDNSLERRLLTKAKTPLADCDIASGEEDINDIQGQYFGPIIKSSTYCMELTGSSPEDSPFHASDSNKQSLRASPKRGKRHEYDSRESSC